MFYWFLLRNNSHCLRTIAKPRCRLSSTVDSRHYTVKYNAIFLMEPLHFMKISVTFMFPTTVYPKKYAHGFAVLCFVVVIITNSHEVFIHIHQGCFAGTGAIVRLPQCQWSKPDGYGKISQCITTTKHSKAVTVCIFLGIYCVQDGVRYLARHGDLELNFRLIFHEKLAI